MQWQGVKTILRLRTHITDLFMFENTELSPVFMQFATKKVITTPFSLPRSAASSEHFYGTTQRENAFITICAAGQRRRKGDFYENY